MLNLNQIDRLMYRVLVLVYVNCTLENLLEI
jgi:hypothetical protein